MKTVFFTTFVQTLLLKDVLLTSYDDFPWTSLLTQFNQITERIEENDGKVLKSDRKLLQSLIADIETNCLHGKIREFYGPSLHENDIVAGIQTKTYVLVFPDNTNEERFAWILPAVKCKVNIKEHGSITITHQPSKNSLIELKHKVREEQKTTIIITKQDSSGDEEQDSSSSVDSSEEKDRVVSKTSEKTRVAVLEQELLLAAGSEKVEGEIREVYYEITTNGNQEHDKGVPALEKENAEISERKYLVFAKEEEDRLDNALKQEEYLTKGEQNKKSATNKDKHKNLRENEHYLPVENWETTQTRNAEAERREHDHAITKTSLNKKKDLVAAEVTFEEDKALRATADTINRDLPKVPHSFIEEENQTESEIKEEYIKPEEPKKELLTVKPSRHFSLRRRVKSEIPP